MAKEKQYQLCKLKVPLPHERIHSWTFNTKDRKAYEEARDKGELDLLAGTVLFIEERSPKYDEYGCQLWQEKCWPTGIRCSGRIVVKMDEVELTEKVPEAKVGTHWDKTIRGIAIYAKLRRMLKEGAVLAERIENDDGSVTNRTYTPGQELRQWQLNQLDYNHLRYLTQEELLTHDSEGLRLQAVSVPAFYVKSIQEGFEKRIANVDRGLAQLERLSEDLREAKGFIPGHLKRRDSQLYKLIRQRLSEHAQDCDLAQAYQEILDRIEDYKKSIACIVEQVFSEIE